MHANSSLVSVVIPSYNYGHFVTEAVDSALAQTYPNVEVIVVDDGSKDDTPQRLRPYAGRIVYIRQENQGLSAARNTGIAAAKGDYIALLDADDAFHPRKLELQMPLLTANADLALLATEAFIDPALRWPEWSSDSLQLQPVTIDSLVTKSRFAPSSVVVRKQCFDAVGLFDTELRSVEDRDMWIRIAARFSVAMLNARLTWYRLQPGSMSRNAAKMEHFERVVLDRAFATEQLRGRRMLRRKARGLADYSAAYMYMEAGECGTAIQRMMKSFWKWPLPLRVPDVRMPWARVRLCAAIARRAIANRMTTAVAHSGRGAV